MDEVPESEPAQPPEHEPAPNRDPRARAAAATHSIAIVYLIALVGTVLLQALFGAQDTPPVLQRLLPGAMGWRELALGIGAGVGIFLLQLAMRPWSPWMQRYDQLMFGILGKPTAGQCLILAGTSSLAEEVFFRGILQERIGLVAASILFGLAHSMMWQWAVFATAMGVLFGLLFEATGGGLLAPVAAHFTINLIGLTQLARECPEDAPPIEEIAAEPSGA